MSSPELDWFYNQLKDHYLEPLEIGQYVKSYYLRQRPDSRAMSTLLIFSPEGIIITGDLRPGNNGGVVAAGYGLDWFSAPLQPRYLAEKFLKEKWVPGAFIKAVKDYINDRFESRTLSIKRHPWRIGHYVADNWTEGRALLYLINHSELIESPHSTYDNLPAFRREGMGWYCPYDSEFLAPGYDYDPAELGWLAAIQRRFSELREIRTSVLK